MKNYKYVLFILTASLALSGCSLLSTPVNDDSAKIEQLEEKVAQLEARGVQKKLLKKQLLLKILRMKSWKMNQKYKWLRR